MFLKTENLDQGATEMFISVFENKESLCDAISKIYKYFKRSPELSEMRGN